MLNLYRRLITLRKESVALRVGSYLSHPSATDEVLMYRRESDEDTKTVAMNLSDEPQEVQLRSGKVLFSTADPDRNERFKVSLALEPREGVVVGHG